MRNGFEQQLTIGITPIEDVKFRPKHRDPLVKLLKGLQYIYTNKDLNAKVSRIVAGKVTGGKKSTGRNGMGLWEIFVMAQVRLGLNTNYDRLLHMANYDDLMRLVMGVQPNDYTRGKDYEYQNIYDNVNLLDDEALRKINDVIVEAGHGVFKKKEKPEPLSIKSDSFVVESNVHFPADYNILWDSCRKCLDCISYIEQHNPELTGWRKLKNWGKELKNMMLSVGKISAGGGKNKQERLEEAANDYLTKASALSHKIHTCKDNLPFTTKAEFSKLLELEYFLAMLDKHIDLVERRLIKGEVIPQEEKMYSIFETYTHWIKKGKSRPDVELGEKLLVSTDQYGLIVDYDLIGNNADATQAIHVADRLLSKYEINSLSFDKGFWSKENKELLSLYIPEVIMPKRGKLSSEEKEVEQQQKFKTLRNAHNAVESNINELEHRGLDRCPDRSYGHFKRYVSLGVCAYNLQKIGKELIRQEEKSKEQQARAA